MKDVTDIFLIEEGVLVINKPEVRTVKEFNVLLMRDKGGKVDGDYDGRRKLYAFKELMYIYLYNHPASIYRDLPDEFKHEKCVTHSLLEDTWKPDDAIKKATKAFFGILDMSALYHSYINAHKAIYALGEDLKFFNTLRDNLRKKIEDANKLVDVAPTEEERQQAEAVVDHKTSRLMDIGIKINNISNSLPTAFDTVETLKQKLLKESEVGGKIYGGGQLNNREE